MLVTGTAVSGMRISISAVCGMLVAGAAVSGVLFLLYLTNLARGLNNLAKARIN